MVVFFSENQIFPHEVHLLTHSDVPFSYRFSDVIFRVKAVMFPVGLRVHFQGQKHSFSLNKGQQRYEEDQ